MKKKFLILTNFILIFTLFAMILNINTINVYANAREYTIQVDEGEGYYITIVNNNTLSYKRTSDNVEMGTVKLKQNDEYLNFVKNDNKIVTTFEEQNEGDNFVIIVIDPKIGFNKGQSYLIDDSTELYPGEGDISIQIDEDMNATLVFNFSENQSNNDNQPNNDEHQNDNNEPNHIEPVYPIVAEFEGIPESVEMDADGNIIIPDNWKSGKVKFKAKACKHGEETIANDGMNICDNESEFFETVRIEGIVGLSNHTVTGGQSGNFVTVTENFKNYKKETIHITSANEGSNINTIIALTTKDLISIKATSPIAMSYSVGSSAVNQAMVSENVEKDISIFFGNTKTTLEANGLNVKGIKSVTGAKNVTISNGKAIVELPNLSIETTTKVKVTIELKDGSTIIRTINIKRTAILLDYDKREKVLKAGYVANKGYLYNNKNHDDKLFNAYLQVIFYKDNVVSGFKQVKINDEKMINSLLADAAWSIEIFSEDAMTLLEKDDTGINGASVFLTNGPINYNDDKLPSIEFGIGSGLKIEWEVND